MRLAQAGDRDAFARLVTRHGAAATRAAAWFGAGPDTDDVVQEAFVKAWRAIDRFRADPAIASSIFVTMTTDSMGFLVFLGLAVATGLA